MNSLPWGKCFAYNPLLTCKTCDLVDSPMISWIITSLNLSIELSSYSILFIYGQYLVLFGFLDLCGVRMHLFNLHGAGTQQQEGEDDPDPDSSLCIRVPWHRSCLCSRETVRQSRLWKRFIENLVEHVMVWRPRRNRPKQETWGPGVSDES